MTMRGGSLIEFARNRYSQNGEDGILCELLRRLNAPEPGTFVEFGVGNGRDISNTLRLAECGWSGVWMECNLHSAAQAALEAKAFHGRVEMLHTTVELEGDNSLDAILARTNLPFDFDFLSIDVDSIDLALWDSLKSYQPKIVLIEINSSFPLGVEYVHEPGGKEGNSFTSMVKLGTRKGYTVVCHTGNLFFVANALVGRLCLPASELESPDSIFNDMWSQWAK